ncbi:MAG: ATP synthase subunit C [Exilibacterium sp.]
MAKAERFDPSLKKRIHGYERIGGSAGLGGIVCAHGAGGDWIDDTETGHGRFIGVSAMPSSQVIYGIVVMFTLNRALTLESAAGLLGVGFLTGIALMLSAIRQGQCCAAAIHATKAKPEIFAMSLAPAAIVEGFAVFAFVFALVISAGIPGGA